MLECDSELSTTTSAESIPEEEWAQTVLNRRLYFQYKEIINLCQQENHYGVLARMSSVRKSAMVPPLVHFLLGCTLFNLGRVGGALREVSLAIELQPSLEKREQYIRTLARYLYSLGMTEKTIACFGEIISMSNFQEGQKGLQSPSRSSFHSTEIPSITNNDSSVDKCSAGYRKSNHTTHPSSRSRSDRPSSSVSCDILCEIEDILLTSPKPLPPVEDLHIQAMKFVRAGGRLSDNSLGAVCMAANLLLEKIEGYLQRFTEETNLTRVQLSASIVSTMFDTITLMAPEVVFKGFFENYGGILLQVIEFTENLHPEVNYADSSPKGLVKQLKIWGNRECNSVVSISSTAIKLRMILGFRHFYRTDYFEAAKDFDWCTKFLPYLYRKVHLGSDDAAFTPKTKIIATIFSLECYLFSRAPQPKLSRVFSDMIVAYSDNPTSNLRKNVILSSGKYFEELARLEVYGIEVEGQALVRLNRGNLEEMLSKYILCTVNMLPGDPGVIYVFDRIIWGVMMCGGIHLYTLWFFMVLKDHYFIEFDFGSVNLTLEHDYRIFQDCGVMEQYENGWDLVDGTYELSKLLNTSDGGVCWDPDRMEDFSLPVLFEQKTPSRLVIYDGIDEEDDYYFADLYHLRARRKSALKKKRTMADYEQNLNFSKRLVRLWLEACIEVHGVKSIPFVVEGCLDEVSV